jgi:hypothetical protein
VDQHLCCWRRRDPYEIFLVVYPAKVMAEADELDEILAEARTFVPFLVEFELLDLRRRADTEHATPYVGTEHAIHLALSPYLRTVRRHRRGLALLASGCGHGAHGRISRAPIPA